MKYKRISPHINKDQQLSTNSRAQSVPLAHQRPTLSYMLCANYKYINNIFKQQQISTNISKDHEIQTHIIKYQQISNKYLQIAKPEVCHWPTGDQIYHICYAQTMRKPIDRWPVWLAENLCRERRVLNLHTNIYKYQQISTNISKCHPISRQIIKYKQISTNYQQLSTNIIKYQQLSTNDQQISTNT